MIQTYILIWGFQGNYLACLLTPSVLNAISVLIQTPLKKLGFHKMLNELASSSREIMCACVFVCVSQAGLETGSSDYFNPGVSTLGYSLIVN